MELKNKNILIVSPESWGIHFISKHHYAMMLSRTGNVVFFLNPPSGKFNIQRISENLIVVNYKKIFPGLRFLPEYVSSFLNKLEITYLEKKLNTSFNVIWNFDSSRLFALSRLKDKLKISHIVDWSENINRELLCKSSDICLCSNQILFKELSKYNEKTYNIGHGYNPSDYSLSLHDKQSLDSKYKIKAGYIGNLSLKYIDWQTILNLIKENKDIGFYFIGPEAKSNLSRENTSNREIMRVKNMPNALFPGSIPGEKIPAYLECFDLLFLVYKDSGNPEQLANPHKILEYLGSGKVVISTWISEYQNNQDLVYMVAKNSDYVKKFNDIRDNLGFYNMEKFRKKRSEFALKNSYQEKIRQIEGLINTEVN